MHEILRTDHMPVLALRGIVVFPRQTVHFDVARDKSVKALEKAMESDQVLILVPQKNLLDEDPGLDKLHTMGTVVKVKQMLRTQTDVIRVLVHGLYRANILELSQNEPFMAGKVEMIEDQSYTLTTKARALIRDANLSFGTYAEMTQQPSQPLQLKMMASTDPGFIADCLGQHVGFDYPDKIKLLSTMNPNTRLERAVKLMSSELEMLAIEMEIQSKARESMEKGQRDYYLREQMKAIRHELGEGEDENDADRYSNQIKALKR